MNKVHRTSKGKQAHKAVALGRDALERIARMKLDALGGRLRANNGMALHYSEDLVEAIVERCREVDTGARNIDHILAANVLPQLAQTLLEKMSEETPPASGVGLDVGEDGSFIITFADAETNGEQSASEEKAKRGTAPSPRS